MALPTFIGIGAQKAGTTPLFYLLRQHPDIFLHPEKEIHFFSGWGRRLPAHLYEWRIFDRYGGQRAIGEITPEYIRTPGVARAIRVALGPVRIIICLREPLARAFSHYLHCLRSAEDNRSFFEACQTDAQLAPWSEATEDIVRAYVRGSRYPYQIEEWQHQFGAENLFFCVLERDFADAEAKTRLLGRLFAFLGVTSEGINIKLDVPNSSAPCPTIIFLNHSGVIRSPTGEIAFESGDISIQAGRFRRILRRPSPTLRYFFEKMARDMTRRLEPEAEQILRFTYFDDIAERVSELIGQDITHYWNKTGHYGRKAGTYAVL
jgi:hypothetical protein